MKTKMIYAVVAVSLLVQCAIAQRKEFKEEVNKEIAFEKESTENTLIVQNLNGNISVEGYNGKTIQLVVEKRIQADKQEDVDLGKEQIGLHVLTEGNKIIVYPEIPNMTYENGHMTSTCNNKYVPLPYEHRLDFTVKIPKNIRLIVGTINQGEVEVKGTQGSYVKANNVNGGIVLKNITGQTDVHAINGEVKVSYVKNPSGPSSYYALNGDINIVYQQNLSAAIAFKSMNGELFTDFDIVKQYSKTSKDTSNNKGKLKFKFSTRPIVQIGAGKLDHNFETLNGNVIIKKI